MKRFARRPARAALLAIACALFASFVAVAAGAAAGGTPTSGPLSKPPKVTPPTGAPTGKLVKLTLVKGTGAKVGSGDIVTINQVIASYAGKVLETTWTSRPLTENLAPAQVIPGLIKGLTGARVCSRRELIIPARLTDAPPSKLPATRTTLIYIVDVLSAMPVTGGANHVCGPNSQPSS
jgi:FKBP-type peptidyl-prolyl cis-trans isomerase